MPKRIVITGPTGAVGMALIQNYIAHGCEVVALCHRGSSRNEHLPESPLLHLVETDLADFTEITASDLPKCDIFYHLAWRGTTGAARNDMKLQTENIASTIAAVELAKRLGCHTFIGAGSQAEYGRVEGMLKPQTPAFPENGYGMAKLCAGQMSRLLCEEKGLRHIWVRILSVYGPYDGENSMVSSTIRKLLAGGHAAFTPGEQLWDYLYSGDAAEALRLLGKMGHDGATYVLGSGHAIPLKEYINELYHTVQKQTGCTGSIGIGELPYADRQVMYLAADISRLTADTGFMPQTGFGEGIGKILEEIKNGNESEEIKHCHSLLQ